MKINLSIFEKRERKEYKSRYKELGLDKLSYASFIDADFEWACDNCLATKKAILASPGKQHTPWWPNLAYADTSLRCSKCKEDFLFTKEEKKAWYESYQLPTKAQPSNCLNCRRRIRQHKTENKTLSDILKKSENEITDEELKTIIDIYIVWEKLDRVKYYQAILNKRLRRSRI